MSDWFKIKRERILFTKISECWIKCGKEKAKFLKMWLDRVGFCNKSFLSLSMLFYLFRGKKMYQNYPLAWCESSTSSTLKTISSKTPPLLVQIPIFFITKSPLLYYVTLTISHLLCENLCEKIFRKLTKIWKIWKNMELVLVVISVDYWYYRRYGSLEALSSNP